MQRSSLEGTFSPLFEVEGTFCAATETQPAASLQKKIYASSLSIMKLFWPILIHKLWDRTGKDSKIPQARAALDVG
jgi:hypothetical protein